MNKSIRLFTIIAFIVTAPVLQVFSQQKPVGAQKNAASSEADIIAIRAEFNRINALPLKRETFKFESSGCVEEGVITYYKNNNIILKLTESGSIGDGSWTTDYYYSSAGKLIFCFDSISGGAASEKQTTTEYRLYAKNDKAIRCMEGKKIVQPDDKATDKFKTAYSLFKAYQTKNFAAALCD